MRTRTIFLYAKGYKYQLKSEFFTPTILRLQEPVSIPGYVYLDTNGDLNIHQGYAWDGASGPTYDFKSDLAASLVHDALCQLIEEGLLSIHIKPDVDRMLRLIMIEDGALPIRSWIYEKAVNVFGHYYLKKKELHVSKPGKVYA